MHKIFSSRYHECVDQSLPSPVEEGLDFHFRTKSTSLSERAAVKKKEPHTYGYWPI